jgi:hypothetical protein
MAAVGRTGETTSVNDNIYDNDAKEITPEKVRAALAVIIESNFNLVDDLLKNANYDTGVTLEEKVSENTAVLLNTKSSLLSILSATEGQFYNGDSNATWQVNPADGNHDNELWLDVVFPTVGTTSYIPIINFEVNGTWYNGNAVFATYSHATATSIRLYFQRVYDNPNGTCHLTLLKV